MLNYVVNKFSDKYTVENILDLFQARTSGTSKVYDFLTAKGASKPLIQKFFARLQQKQPSASGGNPKPFLWVQLMKEIINLPGYEKINQMERGSAAATKATEALIKTLKIEVRYKNGHITLSMVNHRMPLVDVS